MVGYRLKETWDVRLMLMLIGSVRPVHVGASGSYTEREKKSGYW